MILAHLLVAKTVAKQASSYWMMLMMRRIDEMRIDEMRMDEDDEW